MKMKKRQKKKRKERMREGEQSEKTVFVRSRHLEAGGDVSSGGTRLTRCVTWVIVKCDTTRPALVHGQAVK